MSANRNAYNRATKLFVVDYMMLLCVMGSVVTGIVLWLFVGRGPLDTRLFLGWHRHEWGDLHLYFSIAFVVLAVLHFVQHWRWIKVVTPKQVEWAGGRGSIWRTVVLSVVTVGCVLAMFGWLKSSSESYGRGQIGGRNRYDETQSYRQTENTNRPITSDSVYRPARNRVRRRGSARRVAAKTRR